MSCPTCERWPCVCVKSTTPVFRNTYRPHPRGITKFIFGVQLYEAIKRVGAIKQLRHYLTVLMEDPVALNVMREREQEQRRELANLLPQLTEQELSEFRFRYPEVTTW